MGPPGGGKAYITPRFVRHFNVVSFAIFDEQNMQNIFRTIIKWYMTTQSFVSDVVNMD